VEAPAVQPPEIHIPETQRQQIEKEQDESTKYPLPPEDDINEDTDKHE
jgi:hypothetical protein